MPGQIRHLFAQSYGTSVDNTYELFLRDDSSEVLATAYSDSGPRGAVYAPYTPTDEWHHFAMTHDGETLRLYLDGALAGDSPLATPPADGSPVRIGADDNGGTVSSFWHGWIASLRVWDRALSEAEVAALAAR